MRPPPVGWELCLRRIFRIETALTYKSVPRAASTRRSKLMNIPGLSMNSNRQDGSCRTRIVGSAAFC